MRALIVLICLFLIHASCAAANYTWTGNSDSLWSNALNWSGGGSYPSSSADNVTINHNTVEDFIRLTENITVNNITWNERKNRGLHLNGFDLIIDGDLNMANNTKLKMEKSNGQLLLNTDLNTGTGSTLTLYDVNQTSGDFNIETETVVNILNPTTKVDITLDQINMSDKSFLFFKNTKNVTLTDLNVGAFCVIEFPRNKTTTFTSIVNWNESDCSTFNTFRSFKPGIQAKLKFIGGASTGNFNAYEDIRIVTSGGGNTFTANSRTNLGNNTSISGTTLSSTSCQFDGNGNNTGNWSDANEWDCGCTPRSIDDITIQANKTVTVDELYAQCNDLTFAAANSRISGGISSLLEIHGSLTTFDEENFSAFLGQTEFRNDITGTTETLSCSNCDTIKFFGTVLFEFPDNTWQSSDNIKVTDPNDNRRGDLTVESGTLDMNSLDLEFESDLDINDLLTTGTGAVRAINEENSTIRIDGTADLFDLIIDKSSATNLVTIRTNVMVTNNLDLSGLGIITIENTLQDTLILTDGATVTGGSNDCHVNPSMMKIGNDNFNFPVGNGTFYRPIGVTDMLGNSTANDRLYAEYFLDNPFNNGMTWTAWTGSINNVSTREYWEIDDVVGAPTPQIILSWLDPNPSGGVGNISELRVAHWNGSSFDDLGNGSTTGNTSSGTVTSSSNVSGFSPFALASSSDNNSLPIELIHFSATLKNKYVDLNWSTASEINNDKFIIERSLEGGEFIPIKEVKGAGNSFAQLEYHTIDHNLPQGNIYYRLKQIDFDGTESLSDVKVIRNILTSSAILVYPNPVKANATINIQGLKSGEQEFHITILDVKGTKVFYKKMNSLEKNEISIQEIQLKPGVYFLRLTESAEVTTLKVVIK